MATLKYGLGELVGYDVTGAPVYGYGDQYENEDGSKSYAMFVNSNGLNVSAPNMYGQYVPSGYDEGSTTQADYSKLNKLITLGGNQYATYGSLGPYDEEHEGGGIVGTPIGDPFEFYNLVHNQAQYSGLPDPNTSQGASTWQSWYDPEKGFKVPYDKYIRPYLHEQSSFGDKLAGALPAALFGGIVGLGSGLGGAVAADSGLASALPDSYWSMMADAGGTASDAAAAGAGSFGGLTPAELEDMLSGASMQQNIGASNLPSGVAPNFYNSDLGMGFSGAAGYSPSFNFMNLPTQPPASVQNGPTNPSNGPNGSIPGVNNAGASSAIGRILSGNGTVEDYLSVGGSIGGSLLGLAGADAQRSALNSNADKYLNLGSPYRGLLAQSYMPGFSMQNEPGYKDAIDQSTNSFLRAASAGNAPGVSGGNPMDNPGAWGETLKYVTANTALPQLNTYRSQLGTFGQLGVNQAGTSNLAAASNAGNGYNAVGYGVGNLSNPASSIADLMKKLGQLSTPSNSLTPSTGWTF